MERLAGRVILLWGWRRALAALSQPPFDFFAACFVAFPVLVWLLDGAASQPGEGLARRAARPFLIGWWFGFGYFLAGLWWTGAALLVEAELFAWALPLAVIGLPALLGVFYGLAALAARPFWNDGAGRIAALAASFAVAEWLRGFVLSGFPWNAIGQAAMPVPVMMQSVGIVSMAGINALAVFVFSAPALLASRRGRIPAFAVAALAAALHVGYGAWRLDAAQAAPETLLHVRIVQPSIAQSEKWDAAIRDRIFATLIELSARPVADGAAAPDLIVWPETSVPFLLSERPQALTALAELLGERQTLFAGAVRLEGERADARYYNAIVAVDGNGEIVASADKMWLVPFGEFMPFADLLSRIGVEKLVRSVSAFTPGSQRPLLAALPGVAALPFICYEIIFPGMAGFGDTGADFILNVTNDAWFGDTPGPYQHFRQAQIRAVEAGRPLVRAANNGISGVVDAYGRIVDAFALDAVGTLDVAVPRQRLAPPVRPEPVGAAIIMFCALWGALGLRRRRSVD